MTLGLEVSSRGPWGPGLPQDGPTLPSCPLTCEFLLESDHILQAGEGPRPHLCARPHLEEVPSVALQATYLSTEGVSWEAGEAGREGSGLSGGGGKDRLEAGLRKSVPPTQAVASAHSY